MDRNSIAAISKHAIKIKSIVIKQGKRTILLRWYIVYVTKLREK